MPASVNPHPDEEYTLPRAEALLAGTLALMTGHVQATQTLQQLRLAAQIAANLAALARDPALSPGFAHLLCGLQQRWQAQGTPARDASTAATQRLWCAPPTALQ